MQGEGPSTGRSCCFLRLGGCNLTCTWCDTPYTWDWTGSSKSKVAYRPADELHPMTVEDVTERLTAFGTGLVVVSGGEPLSQQTRLLPVVRALRAAGTDVEIETNGTVVPAPEWAATGVRFNVSPKLAHSGVALERRIVPGPLTAFNALAGTCFKFVCSGPDDLAEVEGLVRTYGLENIWIMPRGHAPEEIAEGLRALADPVGVRRWNLTGRLHVTLWGNQRGV
ncbi:7-carboxy-7-deazaguanine synthase QueE [Streptomyces sp. NEAU-W12]|uniref:7-carboxy-7-deazaguanine synthase QueE n=1 Tax=Streptomyces sp. NEAU-W12 TaxID=2994668 RepID=UPI00224A8377|nr:7-carboxy-7-deazaguanine synthase QueE [Streptomyces sp. NEAU-W12]MCX2924110.1 7-carboxy-7-deazaguanine synthase QueE [Streptomyces sp. NEAU-W12]